MSKLIIMIEAFIKDGSILYFVSLFFGLFLVSIGLRRIIIDLISKNWPFTEGIIKKSFDKIEYDEYGNVLHIPKINYSYIVNSKEYFSGNITFGNRGISFSNMYNEISNKNDSLKVLSKYTENSKVKVFYCPNNPKVAVLKPGITTGAILVLSSGLIITFFTSLIIFSMLRVL